MAFINQDFDYSNMSVMEGAAALTQMSEFALRARAGQWHCQGKITPGQHWTGFWTRSPIGNGGRHYMVPVSDAAKVAYEREFLKWATSHLGNSLGVELVDSDLPQREYLLEVIRDAKQDRWCRQAFKSDKPLRGVIHAWGEIVTPYVNDIRECTTTPWQFDKAIHIFREALR